ncbi:MAG TPA: thioredoxin domain-containing protein [Acidimicrobiales bacterium]
MSEHAQLSIPVGPDDHSSGPLDAQLTVIEYGDYQCPYCGQAYPIVERLRAEFADSMRFVFRNLPLAEVHPNAEAAAEVAEAVGVQGKFWEIHDQLFENQNDLSAAALLRYVEEVGADVKLATQVIADGIARRRVESDLEGAIRSGANGTPTFFINGERYDGSWLYQPFADHLTHLLEG